MGGLVPIALFNTAGQLMGLLGNISLGLSAFWLGTIMIIPRLWDVISDPIMGHRCSRTVAWCCRDRLGGDRPGGRFSFELAEPALGKNKTLLIAILLMCATQLAKIICYNPQRP